MQNIYWEFCCVNYKFLWSINSFGLSEYKENVEIFEFGIQINEQFIILKQLTAHLVIFYVISENTPKQT